jgi:hypothetical protein
MHGHRGGPLSAAGLVRRTHPRPLGSYAAAEEDKRDLPCLPGVGSFTNGAESYTRPYPNQVTLAHCNITIERSRLLPRTHAQLRNRDKDVINMATLRSPRKRCSPPPRAFLNPSSTSRPRPTRMPSSTAAAARRRPTGRRLCAPQRDTRPCRCRRQGRGFFRECRRGRAKVFPHLICIFAIRVVLAFNVMDPEERRGTKQAVA